MDRWDVFSGAVGKLVRGIYSVWVNVFESLVKQIHTYVCGNPSSEHPYISTGVFG